MKLHLATAELKSFIGTESLKYVKVTKEFCLASDANMLINYPTKYIFDEDFISRIPDNGYLIHQDDWKEIVKAKGHIWKSEGIIKCLMGTRRDTLIECESESNIAVFPNFEQVTPCESSLNEVESINIDAKKLLKLQEAMGVVGLNLQFTNKNGAILVTPTLINDTTEGIIGVIMPLSS